MQLRGRTALVTGASGFVGGHLARRLASVEGMHVRALVRNPHGKTVVSLQHPNIEIVRGDLLQPTSLAQACEGVHLVVHAAMRTDFTTRQIVWTTAVRGTENLYQAAHHANVERLIYISSFSVYAGTTVSPYNEATPVGPCGDLYADAKIATEAFLQTCVGARPIIIIVRPPIIYGPGSWFWSIRLLEVARHGRLFLPGGGTFPIAYIFIDNLIDALIAAAQANVSGSVYNVFDGHMSYRDFVKPYLDYTQTRAHFLPIWLLWLVAAGIELPLRLAGWWVPLCRTYVRFLTTGHGRSPQTPEKAEHELGWTSRIDFETGMQCTRAWLYQQGYLD